MRLTAEHHLVAREQHVALIAFESAQVGGEITHASAGAHLLDQLSADLRIRPNRQRGRQISDHLLALALEQMLEGRVDVDVQAV